MENLTAQLRRSEADAEKCAHDLKALEARLECAEQDKTSLEHRARAVVEEHRMDRARWFVHKQVRRLLSCVCLYNVVPLISPMMDTWHF